MNERLSIMATSESARNFAEDFLLPAIRNLTDAEKRRVAVALDCAVVFGALEVHEACNASLSDSEVLTALYAEKVEKLKGMA